jgi:hypothetical protein
LKSFGNKASLVTCDLALQVAFLMGYPVVGNDVHIVWHFNEFPGAELLDSDKLSFNYVFPVT